MQGYLLIAIGQRYIDEAKLLVDTLRKQGDNRPVVIIIDSNDVSYFINLEIDAKYVILNGADNDFKYFNTDFERKGTYPKIKLYHYSPFEETIFVDSDVLCQTSTEKLWSFVGSQQQDVLMTGRKHDMGWAGGDIGNIISKFGKHIPHVHGGFVYFRKPQAEQFYSFIMETVKNYDRWCGWRHYKGSMPDELLYAMTFGEFGYEPVNFDQFPIMTFDIPPDQIPTKFQTSEGKTLDDYIPFIHMINRSIHKPVYDKIINQ